MSEHGLVRLPVLVDEDVWDDFAYAIRTLAPEGRWTAPRSGRSYVVVVEGRRAQVDLVAGALAPAIPGDEIDADLFQLACAVQDTVPGEWSSEGLRRVAETWGWSPPE